MKKKAVFLLLLALFSLAFGFRVGSTPLSWGDIWDIFAHKWFQQPTTLSNAEVIILWDIRVPRVFLSFLVGGSLAISGAIAQSVLQNPLASPFTLGVSSGASLGAALVIFMGLQLPFFPQYTQITMGFLFGIGTIFFVLGLSFQMDKGMSNTSVVLTGMVISLFFNGILSTLMVFFSQESSKMVQWSMGSFAMRGWSHVEMIFPVMVLGLLLSLALARELDLFSFGSAQAQSMGVATVPVKVGAFILMAWMTGACIAVSGIIGFVDLIAPHVARKWVGNRHIALLPASFLIGGTLMTATDTVARTILAPSELPVGAVTALLGAPFFFYTYRGQQKKE